MKTNEVILMERPQKVPARLIHLFLKKKSKKDE